MINIVSYATLLFKLISIRNYEDENMFNQLENDKDLIRQGFIQNLLICKTRVLTLKKLTTVNPSAALC